MAGRYVKETQLVRARFVVGFGLLDRIARILQIDKVDAFNHTAIGNVQTWDDADADGHQRFAIAIAVARSSLPS